MPPKRPFTTTMANTEPTAACQSGIFAGRFRAKRSPVTTADRSHAVCCSFFTMRLKINSAAKLEMTHTAITAMLAAPKNITDATAAGKSAMITSNIMDCVLLWAKM